MSDHGIGEGHPHTERVYVKVTAEFDSTGYMQPVAITWSDGRTSPSRRCWSSARLGWQGTIHHRTYLRLWFGKKALYLEHIDPRFTGRLGRWFIKKQAGSSEEAAGDSKKIKKFFTRVISTKNTLDKSIFFCIIVCNAQQHNTSSVTLKTL